MKHTEYTEDEQYDACVKDLLNDADHADRQAQDGPYFPELGITAESLQQYAEECRQNAERMKHREVTLTQYIRGALDKRKDGTIRE